MANWQVQEAKSHFSELLEAASRSGPQTITRHGKRRAVVLSAEEYEKLSRDSEKKQDESRRFVEFLLNGPQVDHFEIERDRDTGREIEW